jgi:hypothetical protein
MEPMTLQALLLVVLSALSPTAPKTGISQIVAYSIASAVSSDADVPLTGSREGDAVLMLRWAYGEDPSFRICAVGDGGKALGPFQLQNAPESIACDPTQAAKVWLIRAHANARLCKDNPPDVRLASLASGKCDRGWKLTAKRVQESRILLDVAHVAMEAEASP